MWREALNRASDLVWGWASLSGDSESRRAVSSRESNSQKEGHKGCSGRTGWWVVGAPSWVQGICQEAVTIVREEMGVLEGEWRRQRWGGEVGRFRLYLGGFGDSLDE